VTEVEMKERKHRIEDAIAATRAAVEEGTVPGGGAALAQVAKELDGSLGLTGEEATGVGIVRKALVEPLRWIAQNAGHDGYVVVGKVNELGWGHGLNAATDEYVDLSAAGIIDPVKVTRNAVSNAVSIAGLLLTTESLVVDKPAESEPAAAGGGQSAEVADRVSQIRKEIEASDSDWDREKLSERLAKLSGGIAVIKVGAATEIEMKERKHRIEDAIAATKAAVEEGTVPGGGAALAQVAKELEGNLGLTGEEALGVSIVRKALVEPLRWIAQNAGHDGYVVVGKVNELGWGHGLNADTDEYVDLVAAGIIDPVKVTRNAVSNAVSIAGLLLTTESLVVEKPADSEPAAGGGHGHSHGGHGHQHGPGF
jgi:chaperonin GroEL (HSP60 family)